MIKNESQPDQNELLEKQTLWDKTLEQLECVSDRLGKPIDAGIKETIVAFMVNKFPTYGSCEGHVEERFGKMRKLRPYIAIGIQEPKERFVGEQEIKNKIATEHGIAVEKLDENDPVAKPYWIYIAKHDVPETPEYLAVRAKNEALQKSILDILESFYQNHRVSGELKFKIQRIGPAGHFHLTVGKENPKEVAVADVEKLRQELLAEQERVREFTQFLKDTFFKTH